MTKQPCLLCGSPLHHLVSSKDAKTNLKLIVMACHNCGLVQQSPMPTDEELKIYYSHHYREDYKKTYVPKPKYIYRAGIAAKNRIDFLTQNLSAVRRNINELKLLDIGAGGGEVVYVARKSGFDASGVEPNEGYSEFARASYEVNVETRHFDAIENNAADIVTLFHVLEHIPDCRKVFRRLHEIVKRDGYLLIEVPNIEQGDASPANIFFKAHLLYFSKSTLISAASEGFTPITVSDAGNLRILFSRNDTLASMQYPSRSEVDQVFLRLKQKGWFEYLTKGGALKKLLRRLLQRLKERKLAKLQPAEILERAIANSGS